MRDALRAEWTKLRTMPGTWVLLAVAVAVTVATGTFVTALGCRTGCDAPRTSLAGIDLGQSIVALVAVLAVGGEYTSGMVRLTLAAIPGRTTVLAAKTVVLTVVVVPAAGLAVAGSLVGGRFALNGYPGLSGAQWRAAVGSVLYLLLIALLGLGIATAVREPAAAAGVVLGLLYLFPIVATAVADPHLRRHLTQIGPMSAGLTVTATTGLDRYPIGPWAGLAVTAAWAAGALLLGGILLRWRDA